MRFYVYHPLLDKSTLYRFALYIHKRLKNDIEKSSDKKLEVRYNYIVDKFIKWYKKPLIKINLKSIIIGSFVIIPYQDGYLITLDYDKMIPYSRTKYNTVARLIEYGNNKIPPYPIIHHLFKKYEEIFNNELFKDFLMQDYLAMQTYKSLREKKHHENETKRGYRRNR